MSNFADNKKATYDYESLENFDAGIVLTGAEVKSIRAGGAHLKGSYLSFHRGELYIKGMHIAPYAKANRKLGYDPEAPRKVLMRKVELRSLEGKTHQKGLTLVPFSLYARGRHIKLRFGLCRGKKKYEKKEKLKRETIRREIREYL